MSLPSDIVHALTLGTNPRIGTYRYTIATQRWWWSPDTFRIHGFEPGEVVPTTALVLAHKHPDDRDRVSTMLHQAVRAGEPFTSMHRIMDAHGDERTLVVVGRGRRDPLTGRLVDLAGYFLDVTGPVDSLAEARATVSIHESAGRRAAIEQAKGILACTFAISPEDAFDVLRTSSNRSNVPLRDVARDVVDLATSPSGTSVDAMTAFLADAGRKGRR